MYNLEGIGKFLPQKDILKGYRESTFEDYGLRCSEYWENYDSFEDHNYSYRDWGYDSLDDMNLDVGFDGDIDAWNHSNE